MERIEEVSFMGDWKKDIEAMRRINATSDDKLNIMCDITDFIVSEFEHRINKKKPNITREELIKILRKELFYCRRDTH